jgi:general secretion pathway protein B
MSFILDALRKSEHERQRQTGPALAEVPVAAPKPRTNAWATGAIALLLVNLVVVGVLLIRKANREPEAAVPAVVPAATQVAPAAAVPAQAQVSMTQTVPSAASPPPMLQPARPSGLPAAGSRNSLEDEMSEPASMLDRPMAEEAAGLPAGPPAVTRAPSGRGSVVYESLPASAAVGTQQYSPPPEARTAPQPAGPKLPTAEEVTAAGGVPALNLDLHVYSTKPAERMIFVNSRKYREGDSLQEGPVVQTITPDGAILEFRGSRFLLSRD